MKKLLSVAAAVMLTALLFSCKRNLTADKPAGPVLEARRWFNTRFDASLTAQNGQLTGGNQYPVWQYAKAYKYHGLQVVEVPLVFKKRTVYTTSQNSGNPAADASLTKLLIARNAAGRYREAVVDVVADSNMAAGYNLSQISLNSLPPGFSGWLLGRNWAGQKVTGYRLTKGRVTNRLLPPGTRTPIPGRVANANAVYTSFGMFCADCSWQLGSGDNVMSPRCEDYSLSCGLDMWQNEYTDPCSLDFVNIFGCPCESGIIDYDHCGFSGDGGVGDEPYQLTAEDIAIFTQIDAQDAAAQSAYAASTSCEGHKVTGGNPYYEGTIEHWIIQLDYVSMYPNFAEREYAIPGSSANGNVGRADLVNKFSNEIFEIKPNNPQGISNGKLEINRYINNANAHCPSNPGMIPPGWHAGTIYPTRLLPSNKSGKMLKAELRFEYGSSTGLILYSYEDIGGNNPSPVVVPQTVGDKLRYLMEKIRQRVSDADKIMSQYLRQNPELVNYIKGAAYTAAAALIVATIIEDIGTGGWGILNDWQSFQLAYRIVRYAWGL